MATDQVSNAEVIAAIGEIASTFELFKTENDSLLKRVKGLEVDADRVDENGDHKAATTEPSEKMEARMSKLELMIQRAALPETKETEEVETKSYLTDPKMQKDAFTHWLRKGVLPRGAETAFAAIAQDIDLAQLQKAIAANPEFAKTLVLSDDTTGGYLAMPPTMAAEIIKDVVDIDPLRSICNVKPIGTSVFEQLKRTGTHAAVWTAESGTRAETEGTTWGKEAIPTHEMAAMIPISRMNLADSAYDLESIISEEFAEQFAVAEGQSFVNGNAVTRPEGFLQNADLAYTANGHATLLQADALLTLQYALKAIYAGRATWVWERLTTGIIRKLKDGEGNYLWKAGIAEAAPPAVLGIPYVEAETMPSVGAGLYPIALGDWMKGYKIVDREGMAVLRDPFTAAVTGAIKFWSWMRVGGHVIQAEAIRKLKIALT